MATERSEAPTGTGEPGFGTVDRTRGIVFEYLSLGASVVGILALAVLLVYVFVDAFDLQAATPRWVATYLGAVVAPYAAFCLRAIDDDAVRRRIVVALVPGAVATYAVFQAFELLVSPVPRLGWHVAYCFAVVAPTIGYATFVASREPVGAVGLGLVGRLLAGATLGLATIVLFDVFEAVQWLLAYTFGVLPAAGLVLYGRRRPDTPASLLAWPVGVVGFLGAARIGGQLTVYPAPWLIYAWTLGVPVAAVLGTLTAREHGRDRGLRLGAFVFATAIVGSLLAELALGTSRSAALLVLLTTVAPATTFVHGVLVRREGTFGIVLPVLLVGGVALGATVVRVAGLASPDPWLDPSYLTSSASTDPFSAGLYPAIVGSVMIIAFVAVLSFLLGVGTAVLLEEYMPKGGRLGAVARLIQINVANLAAVPSVVYGLLGLSVFAILLGTGYGTVVTAALTLSLLILPITIVSAQEAIRGVPDGLRRGSDAMGATRWQTTKNVVLPEAMPGILTGTILALGRAIGETAPLIMIGVPHVSFSPPTGIWSKASAMPMQIFVWSDYSQPEFRYGVVAAGVVTLLLVLIGMNATAIVLRNRSEGGV